MDNRLIEIKDLKVSFYNEKGSIQVVRGFELEVGKGEIIGILGESGSGKTVSVSSILRLIDDTTGIIDSGEILYKGKDLLKATEEELNEIRGNRISYIFQNSSAALNPYKTIGKQLSEVLKTHKMPYTKEIIINSLKEVGINDADTVHSMYPFQLSGGQNQRIMIAQSMLCNPELLIADEPTSSIDASLQKTVLDILKNIREKNETSVIIITHNFGVAKYLCDKLVVMYGGLVVEEGTIKQILEMPFHPYTQELIRCVDSLDDAEGMMYTIEGAPPTPYQFKSECPFYSRCIHRVSACTEDIPEIIEMEDRKVRCIRFRKEVDGS